MEYRITEEGREFLRDCMVDGTPNTGLESKMFDLLRALEMRPDFREDFLTDEGRELLNLLERQNLIKEV